ncbi:USP54 [Cordylochernes scorpioides]|uniref:USP54 n=1 Tax=Cordylochernes scorpioides TaxID=51811 RepID=A0ABY6LPN7_9ARAC|nr:USP54 [Cordylochernes scorpioides]
MPGQNNCFLNSAVQVLWHLDIFRRSFRELSGHACMAESCIFCALKELFTQFQYSQESALPPDALRRALAETFWDQRRFQLGYMDDAAECFENILLRIHFHIANSETEDMCNAAHCIPHQKFSMSLLEENVCHKCGAEGDSLTFTQMVHYVSTSALCSQSSSPDATFGTRLQQAGGLGDIRDCPASCGAKIQIRKSLLNGPDIVSIGLVWDSECPTLDHIMKVFQTLGMSLRLKDVFHSVADCASLTEHQLVGVVTYYGKHYSTFFFHNKLRVWIYFDDATVREIGPRWEQVVEKCRRGHFQPLLLMYSNPHGTLTSSVSAPKTTFMASSHRKSQRGQTCYEVKELLKGGNSLQKDPRVHYANLDASWRPASMLGCDQIDGPKPLHNEGPIYLNYNAGQLQENAEQSDSYISRKTVENVLNFQKLQWQRGGLCNISGNRNSSSSLESFDNLKKEAMANGSRRRDSGSWSGAENPYLYVVGSKRAGGGKPDSLSSDQGYDSYSVSSNDSYPSVAGSPSKLEPRLIKIPEDILSDENPKDYHNLCLKSDIFTAESTKKEMEGDITMAVILADKAAEKAHAALSLAFDSQKLIYAQLKKNCCLMRSTCLQNKLKDAEEKKRPGDHSRESGRHSRQGSRDSTSSRRARDQHYTDGSEKTIELYGTLPKRSGKKKVSHSPDGIPDFSSKPTKSKVKSDGHKGHKELNEDTHCNKSQLIKSPEIRKKPSKSERKLDKKESDFSDYASDWEQHSKRQSIRRSYSGGTSKNEEIFSDEDYDENMMGSKKQHKVRRKIVMGAFLRRKNRSLPDLREGQQGLSDDNGLSLDDSAMKTGDVCLSQLSRGFQQPHHAFVTKDLCNRPLLMRVTPPQITEAANPPASYNKISKSPVNKLPTPVKAPVPPKPPPRIDSIQALTPPEFLPPPPPELLCPVEGEDDVFIQAAEEQPDVNNDAPSGLLAEIQSKREQILQGTSQPKEASPAADPHPNTWLRELQNKQMEMRQKKKATEPKPAEPLKQASSPTKPPSRPALPIKVMKKEAVLPRSQTPDPLVEEKPAAPDNKSHSVRALASRFENIILQKTDEQPATSPAPNGHDEVDFAKPFTQQSSRFLAQPRTTLPSINPVENVHLMRAREMASKMESLQFRVSPDIGLMVTAQPCHLARTRLNSLDSILSRPDDKFPRSSDSSEPDSLYSRSSDQSDNTSQMSVDSGVLTEPPKMAAEQKTASPEEPSCKYPPSPVPAQPSSTEVRRPNKPPDYETAMQRLVLFRDRSQSISGTTLPATNGKKKKGPKKNVTFSDKVILVACADDEPEEHLPNPLLEKVYQQHLQQQDPAEQGQCNLCQQKSAMPPSQYCPDCSVYLSRFR